MEEIEERMEAYWRDFEVERVGHFVESTGPGVIRIMVGGGSR